MSRGARASTHNHLIRRALANHWSHATDCGSGGGAASGLAEVVGSPLDLLVTVCVYSEPLRVNAALRMADKSLTAPDRT